MITKGDRNQLVMMIGSAEQFRISITLYQKLSQAGLDQRYGLREDEKNVLKGRGGGNGQKKVTR